MVVRKRITDGRVGLAIKKVARENPCLPIRDFPETVKAYLGNDSDVPNTTTIHQFLKENQLTAGTHLIGWS